eukprot:scaffold14028_cov123-Skeletonema_dohrnii-CCMP3373.AAC.2
MKTLAEIVSNVQRNAPEEGHNLTRTMSCPSSLSKFSDSSNAIVSINERPKTAGCSSLGSKPNKDPPEETLTKPILPSKRPCCEQSVDKDKENGRPLKTKRFANCSDERSTDATADTANTDVPPPVPTKKNQPAGHTSSILTGPSDPVGFGRTATTSKVSKRSRKRLSRSSTIDNSDIQTVRPMKAMKQQSAAIEKWKLNTIKSRQRNIEQQKQAGLAKNNNLLSSFVQYEDQLQSPALTGSLQRKRRSSTSTTNDSLLAGHDDGVPMCLMDSDTSKKERRRSTQTQSTQATVTSSSSSKSQASNTGSNFSKLSIVLRSFFVICSLLSFISRCLIWFGGRMSILYSMIENPMVWTLRFYISTFHLALLIVELGWGIPIILPRGETLSILTQRGFVQSFLGILDLLLSSNKRMVEHIDILQDVDGDLMSARERRVQISYAIISVSSRGMIVIGCIYFLCGLLYDEYTGKKKKHGGIDR